MIKIALYGDNAAGKTTSAILLFEICSDLGIDVETIRMAAPLYELQAQVYSSAKRPLANPNQQDERLLSILASELRRINPRALHDYVADSICAASRRGNADDVVFLVEDSRPIDRSILKEFGFCFVHIWADSPTRERRIRSRGDIALDTFNASDMTTIENDDVVKNTSDLLSLRNELSSVLQNTLRP